jgi:type IV pilus biogenesis protein CpaD/CtpE
MWRVYMIKRYTDAELKKALDMVEEGCSFSEAAMANNLNKGIVAREMRKRKNERAGQHIDDYRRKLQDDINNTKIEKDMKK